MGTGVSRLEMVRKMFPNECRVLKASPVMDGINKARVEFRRMWFQDGKTKDLRNALSNYSQEWDDKK